MALWPRSFCLTFVALVGLSATVDSRAESLTYQLIEESSIKPAGEAPRSLHGEFSIEGSRSESVVVPSRVFSGRVTAVHLEATALSLRGPVAEARFELGGQAFTVGGSEDFRVKLTPPGRYQIELGCDAGERDP